MQCEGHYNNLTEIDFQLNVFILAKLLTRSDCDKLNDLFVFAIVPNNVY